MAESSADESDDDAPPEASSLGQTRAAANTSNFMNVSRRSMHCWMALLLHAS